MDIREMVGRFLAGCLMCGASMWLGAAHAHAQTEQTLHSFQGGKDGEGPFAPLLLGANGQLYGTTYSGGSTNCKYKGPSAPTGCGVLFRLTPPAAAGGNWSLAILHAFGEHPLVTDGAFPEGALMMDAAGAIYGTTIVGGAGNCGFTDPGNGCGTVYKLDSSGHETVLYTFRGDPDGEVPEAGLVMDAGGNLYGTTYYGGGSPNCGGDGCGTVFRLSPPVTTGGRWKETILHRFKHEKDGLYPGSALVLGGTGTLYGQNAEVVFSLTPPAAGETDWDFEVIYDNAPSLLGGYPQATLLMQGGALYGVDSSGGANNVGSVFKLTPPLPGKKRWGVTDLLDFGGETAATSPLDGFGQPGGGVEMDPAGALYGGVGQVIYKLAPPSAGQTGWTPSVVYEFPYNPTGNWWPEGRGTYQSLTIDTNGNLFGVSDEGGAYRGGTVNCSYDGFPGGCGVVFKIQP